MFSKQGKFFQLRDFENFKNLLHFMMPFVNLFFVPVFHKQIPNQSSRILWEQISSTNIYSFKCIFTFSSGKRQTKNCLLWTKTSDFHSRAKIFCFHFLFWTLQFPCRKPFAEVQTQCSFFCVVCVSSLFWRWWRFFCSNESFLKERFSSLRG